MNLAFVVQERVLGRKSVYISWVGESGTTGVRCESCHHGGVLGRCVSWRVIFSLLAAAGSDWRREGNRLSEVRYILALLPLSVCIDSITLLAMNVLCTKRLRGGTWGLVAAGLVFGITNFFFSCVGYNLRF